jgi:PAS domain-containing protein
MTERIADCGFWRIDVDSPVPEVSPGMMRLLGLNADEGFTVRNYRLLSKIHPADVKRVLKTLRDAMERTGRFLFTCRVNIGDGATRIVRTTGNVETDVNGRAVSLVGVSTDITLVSMAEEKLRENEEKYRLLTERASDVICQLSPSGRIELISPSVRRLMGKQPSELSGTHKGTGLGLAVVKSLTVLHGGKMIIESEIRRGTTASVILPM